VYGTVAFTGIVAAYCGLVLLGAERIVTLAFRKPEIIASTHLLWPLAAAAVLGAAGQGAGMALLAENRTQAAFVSRVASVLGFAAGAAVLGPLMGVEGLLWANAAANALGTAWLVAAALAVQKATRKAPSLRATDTFLKPT
jgi:O-antigen/teichoic acid export membrane protein